MPATPTRYSRPQIVLHWMTAAFVVAQFVFHESIADARDRIEDGLTPAFDLLVTGHVAAALWHQLVLRDGSLQRMR